MLKNKIKQIETYVKGLRTKEASHGFKHVNRVRNWALQIAKKEGYKDLEAVEAAALLHDIGLSRPGKRNMHGKRGAEMAEKFLRKNNLFPEEKIKKIANAIRHHDSNRTGKGKLLYILRDADIVDAIGAVGIMRCFICYPSKPEYDPKNIKGETWGMTAQDFNKRIDSGMGPGKYIVDVFNFQISFYDNLKTKTGKKLARPLVKLMKNYLVQLESEINEAGIWEK